MPGITSRHENFTTQFFFVMFVCFGVNRLFHRKLSVTHDRGKLKVGTGSIQLSPDQQFSFKGQFSQPHPAGKEWQRWFTAQTYTADGHNLNF
jgi:hypothetical protein